jgi:hypothetical protein
MDRIVRGARLEGPPPGSPGRGLVFRVQQVEPAVLPEFIMPPPCVLFGAPVDILDPATRICTPEQAGYGFRKPVQLVFPVPDAPIVFRPGFVVQRGRRAGLSRALRHEFGANPCSENGGASADD